MTRIIFIQHDGTRHEVEAKDGQSVMEVAIKNSIPAIDADCGGACACATCHVFVAPEWLEVTGAQDDMEQAMLEFAENVIETSRLSCQIIINPDMDGLVVNLPEAQH